MKNKNYTSILSLRETEKAIKFIKDFFQVNFSRVLNLERVSAPIVVTRESGVNDYLNGVESPASFYVKDVGVHAEIVQSLAKWKRVALADYRMKADEGLYTDMNAIRPDEHLDNLHSVYVDQWDWEKIIRREDRDLDFLKKIVRTIYRIVRRTEIATCKKYPALGKPYLPNKIHFIHSEDLERLYPSLSPKDREEEIVRDKGAVFIIGIGAPLADGVPHDGRAPDYDDWWTETKKGKRGLNGDILVFNRVTGGAYELSSMGIRVDERSLDMQLKLRGTKKSAYHKKLLAGKLPLSIGGGIGQSRLCMFFLRKAHIGEVQAGIWPDKMLDECKRKGIELL